MTDSHLRVNPVCRSGQKSSGKVLAKWGLALILAAGAGFPATALSRLPQSGDALETVALEALPAQARQTHERIHAGGPFPYAKDGTVFGNRERLLPAQPRGFYREYTVKTPGARSRGARRIVCGGPQPRSPESCFYTADHYASFRRIVP
jgi:ribonuclease T1